MRHRCQLLFCFLGFDADPAGDREDLAVDVERDQTAPITLCEEIAAEARQIVRVLPRIPERLLDLGRIQIEPLGMLPFSSVKFSGSAGGRCPSGNSQPCSRYRSWGSSLRRFLKYGRLSAFICSGSIRDHTTWACLRPFFSWMMIARG